MDERLEKLITSPPLPTWRSFAWAIIAVVAGFFAWAFQYELDEVTVAEGQVIPKGDLRVVQHLEGGIIKDIFVRQGQQVQAGEPLLLLDVAAAGLSQEDIEIQLYSQMARRARYVAEASGSAPVFSEELRQKAPQMVEAQESTYLARKAEFEATLSVLRSQFSQREQEVKELRSKLESTLRTLEFARQRLTDSEALLKQELTPRAEHLKLQAEVEDLQQEVSSIRGGIVSAEAAVKEARERAQEKIEGFRSEAQSELGKVEEQIAALREQLQAKQFRSAQLEIKSPIDGIVKNMRYSTVGGVVQAGEPIMEIVPTGEQLVVTARLNPTDVGFVTQGQPAKVKVSAYDSVKYGTLDGRVALVAADATQDPEKGPYFEVVVETERNYLGASEGELPITPGMEAMVDIYTGKKSVIDFLVKPVLKMKDDPIDKAFKPIAERGTGRDPTSETAPATQPVMSN